ASTALGFQTVASGDASLAMGYGSVATGQFSIAMGYGTAAIGGTSTSMGSSTRANGGNSIAMGVSTNASGDNSTTMGANTNASGWISTSMGAHTVASGEIATSLGAYTIASGYSSSTMGYYTKAKGYASTVVGIYNDSILLADQTIISPTTPLFIVGNGDVNTRSNAMAVFKNGNVGIGNSNPAFLLDVSGRLRIRSGGSLSSSAGIWFNNVANSSQPAFFGMMDDNTVGIFGNTGATWNFKMNTSNGNVAIGPNISNTQKLNVEGNICYTGSIAACSDIRYKKNLLPIDNALQNVLRANGVYYDWNIDKFPERAFSKNRQLGFSAQEIEKLFPEIVLTDTEGYKSVDYGRLTPVLVEAIKEQQQKINNLEKDISDLKLLIQKIIK
ncbi:MAG TPA: tail fiber domain-containing protein, partial [Ferruginibacter sp.]|nr:tail fiber domain-containing protein [Ferruginibacter sp.]